MEEGPTLIKLLSIGDPQVGKSCIIKRYCEGRFVAKYITTIGIDYGVKKIKVAGKPVAINFFDLSGDDAYEEIRNPFFKDAQVVLLVFDLDSNQSFASIQKWESIMKQHGVDSKGTVTILVGNKSDLKVQNSLKQAAMQFAKKRGYQYMETSASSGDNINELFDKAFNKVIDKIEEGKARIKA